MLDESLARLFELIRIPSISTDPAYAAECLKAAEWLTTELIGLGFDAAVRPTAGRPMVVGHSRRAEGPHVLFYGHYDVQPVDPLGLWETPPFEPTIRIVNNERQIVARGSSDDKGQLMTFIEACRAWKAVTGELPIRVSILFEGEEESGGKSLGPFLDLAATSSRPTWRWSATPTCGTVKRPPSPPCCAGSSAREITITAANQDLHSGMFGGAARNPLQVLGEIIASLRRPDGSVAVEGFYDGVGEVPADVRAQWERLPFDEARFLGDVGLSIPAGEKGRSVLEQIWARPTCEINGVIGGYTGDGFKTVIPAKATAKISFRLVAGQDPERIREAFRTHVQARVPDDCSVDFAEHGASPALAAPFNGPFVGQALKALTVEWGKQAAIIGSGGSIPVIGEFKRRSAWMRC